MGILIFFIIFIFCLIAGFNGIPLMLLFPIASILIIVIATINKKNEFKEYGTDNRNKKINLMDRERNSSNSNDSDIDEFIIYDIINHK